ncbi:MAG TPA: potassium-transporting ATPase subunit KdpA [Thermoanaerobaculia bacterium]|jgi:K+-transporting ATPase ATPase A chain|nr:potassium-transporting ATPase subunit KdpA [Thermoanaerobaculia bacterium]
MVQYGVFLLIVVLLVKPVGAYLARVFADERTWLDPVMRPLERGIYRLARVDATAEMDWKLYAGCFLTFSLGGTLLLYAVLRVQPLFHTFDPLFRPAPLTPDLAMNTAISFATTTTWQAYGGETTMSYLSQLALTSQNFLAGAAGLAVGIAFIRGLARERTRLLGNFWVDVTRATLWVLLPLSVVIALLLVWQGVPTNFAPYAKIALVQPAGPTEQIIAMGPVAALEPIKNLGTNGGGFFNVNGAHPFENPTPLTNLLEMLAIAVLPASLTYTFGRMIGRPRQGWMLFSVMLVLFIGGLLACHFAEQRGQVLGAQGVDYAASAQQAGGNMEGKEARFGIAGSVLAAVATSNGATGSYNSMHDSYTPVGGMVTVVNMLLGEIVFGGLGTGLYSLILIALVGLFVAGLMIGRTPEYLGKQVTVAEMKLIALYSVIAPLTILPLTALALVTDAGLAGLSTNHGAHGLSEILVAFTTSMANNGQNFAGLSANSAFYNITTAVAMMAGRFGLAIPALALAGLFAQQGRRPVTDGTLPTDTALFAGLTIATALIIGALSYVPALALGPIAEHLALR